MLKHGIWFYLKQNLHTIILPTVPLEKTPFYIVYGMSPLHFHDLSPLPTKENNIDATDMSEFMKQLHFDIQQKLKKVMPSINKMQMSTDVSSFFMKAIMWWFIFVHNIFQSAHMGSSKLERFVLAASRRKYSMIMFMKSTCQVVGTSLMSSIHDLYKYHSSESNIFQPGEDDVNLNLFVPASQPSLSSPSSSTNGQLLKSKMKQWVTSPM